MAAKKPPKRKGKTAEVGYKGRGAYPTADRPKEGLGFRGKEPRLGQRGGWPRCRDAPTRLREGRAIFRHGQPRL